MSSQSHYLAHIQRWYTYVQDGNSADKAYQRLCMGSACYCCILYDKYMAYVAHYQICPCHLFCHVSCHSSCCPCHSLCLSFRTCCLYFVRTVFSSVAVAAAVYPLLVTVAPSVVTRSWTTVTFVALKHIPWCLVLGCRSEGDTWLLCPVVNRNVVRTGIWL